jgi:hypothetical protein
LPLIFTGVPLLGKIFSKILVLIIHSGRSHAAKP